MGLGGGGGISALVTAEPCPGSRTYPGERRLLGAPTPHRYSSSCSLSSPLQLRSLRPWLAIVRHFPWDGASLLPQGDRSDHITGLGTCSDPRTAALKPLKSSGGVRVRFVMFPPLCALCTRQRALDIGRADSDPRYGRVWDYFVRLACDIASGSESATPRERFLHSNDLHSVGCAIQFQRQRPMRAQPTCTSAAASERHVS